MTDKANTQHGLALVGVRGTGKSTVGRIIARGLCLPFVDADAELEARAGKSIRAIFEDEGEGAFRDLEEQVLADLTGGPPAVLATGGGAVLRDSNRRRLRQFGLIIWLTARPEALAARIQSNPRGVADRPALTAHGTLAEISAILEARTPIYQTIADATVDTDGRTPAEVADAVLEACQSAERRSGGSHTT